MKQALKLAFQTLKLSKETMESARKKIDELKAENKALKEALTQEKTLQALHSENERLGLYKEAYAEQEPVQHVENKLKQKNGYAEEKNNG